MWMGWQLIIWSYQKKMNEPIEDYDKNAENAKEKGG